MTMDIHEPEQTPAEPLHERDTDWADMNDRLKALQDKYAKARIGSEPRAFATRYRG
jgi:hypothetical protein